MMDAASSEGSLVRLALGILLGTILALAVAPVGATARDDAAADARTLLERGDNGGALRQAKEVLLDDPRNIGALYVAGVASLNLDRLNDAEKYLEILRADPLGEQAAVIGRVEARGEALVTLKSAIGATRIMDMLSGEQLPRIC